MSEPSVPMSEPTVKMSVLARMSGVPAATIKHYVNEGLLPQPTRTSRNMAYYDVSLVPRIQQIKEIQRTRFLPLKVIKEVLDESALGSPEETVTAAIARAMTQSSASDVRTKDELIAAGMPAKQLSWLKNAGIVRPVAGEKAESYTGDDLELLRVLGASRKAGITPEMLPVTILGEYVQAMQALVRIELRMFREGVMPRAGQEELAQVTEAATLLSEKLVVLLRRKMLLPILEELVKSERTEKPSASPAPRKRPTRRPPPR